MGGGGGGEKGTTYGQRVLMSFRGGREGSEVFLILICYSAPELCLPDGQFGLVDGTSDAERQIEVCYAGVWGTVCDDFLDGRAARVVCRQLGYEDTGQTSPQTSGLGLQELYWKDLSCDL